jgi:membrane associated rhomboid family serine protease
MIIPYNTDAPLYHRPIATIGLIAANTLVFIGSLGRPDMEPWMLSFGNGLHPAEWITSLFLHDGIGHLVGNMIFLWVFGLVIEGKLGWWRFLLVYLGLGTFESAVSQISMLHESGYALGASGAIYGILAMSLIWAPSNEISCVGFWSFFYASFFEVSILWFAGFYVLLEILAAWLNNFEMSSAMLHLGGAVPGFALAIAMLKLGLVDCERWDIFAVLSGREGQPTIEKQDARSAIDVAQERAARKSTALALFTNHLAEGRAGEAAALHAKMSQSPDWTLSHAKLLDLIKALHRDKLWSLSVPPMIEYLKEEPDAHRMRLKLAQILIVHENRPSRALRVLQKTPPGTLPPDLQKISRQLESRAIKMREAGELELEEEEC